jgi:NADPH2:quinone reductase
MSEVNKIRMQAVLFTEIGEPNDVLKWSEIPVPEPGNDEVRIKMLASPINPADILFIKGKYRHKPNFPQVAGLEGVGIIEKTGVNCDIPLNTLVAFRHKNVWAEYVIVPIKKVIILPKKFPVDKASQFSLNPLTAYALLEEAKINRNEWLVLTAGNSAVSKIIIQLAKKQGIKTIAVVRKNNDIEDLISLGATNVIIDNSETIVNDILTISGNEGVKCILDAVGGELISQSIKCISINGQLISYGLLSNQNVEYHNSSIIFKNIVIKGFGIDNWLENVSSEKYEMICNNLIVSLSEPEFKMPVSKKYILLEFKKALEQYQMTNNNGKVLMTTNTYN